MSRTEKGTREYIIRNDRKQAHEVAESSCPIGSLKKGDASRRLGYPEMIDAINALARGGAGCTVSSHTYGHAPA
jgi:hypothetical protein